MSILSNTIEQFIKELIRSEMQVDVNRNELAQYFHCAPSQINYVLATRFTVDQGYYIESRRGGGGYIRIIRIDMDNEDCLLSLVTQQIGKQLREWEAQGIIKRLREQGIIDSVMARLMNAAVSNNALNISAEIRDNVRANIMRRMLLSLMREDELEG